MSLIATFRIETPILAHALAAVPDMVLETVGLHMSGDEATKGVFWAEGDSFDTFEANLATDPTVDEYAVLAETGGQRLYTVTYSETGKRLITYPVVVDRDIVLLDMVGSHEGLEIRARFPTHDALFAYRDACRERDIPFHLERLYREERIGDDCGGTRYGITDAQREVLLQALEMGYFDVPRQTTLEAVADELDVSTQAVSTRLRRGEENLVRNTLTRPAT